MLGRGIGISEEKLAHLGDEPPARRCVQRGRGGESHQICEVILAWALSFAFASGRISLLERAHMGTYAIARYFAVDL
jgi:hypothetical protein